METMAKRWATSPFKKCWTLHLSKSVKNRFPSTIVIVWSGSGWMLYVLMPIWKMAGSENNCWVSVYKLLLYAVFWSFCTRNQCPSLVWEREMEVLVLFCQWQDRQTPNIFPAARVCQVASVCQFSSEKHLNTSKVSRLSDDRTQTGHMSN